MQKKKKWKLKDLIAKGDHRIDQIQRMMWKKYQGIPNLSVIPHFGMGTGTDIIVIAQGNKVLELREVTNFARALVSLYNRVVYPVHRHSSQLCLYDHHDQAVT